MTLLGKVFTFLVLLLSMAFFSLAVAVNATHNKWRDEVLNPQNGYKVRVQNQITINTQLRESLERAQTELAQEQAARRLALSALQTQLNDVSAALAQKVSELDNAQVALSTAAETERSTQENLARITKETEQLRDISIKVRQDRDQQFTRTVQLSDQVNALQGDVQAMTEIRDQLSSQVSQMKSTLDVLGVDAESLLDKAPPVNGVIAAVNSQGLVELSIGADDGLRPGHQLDVYRGAQYLGRVKVTRADDDKSIAQIMTGFRRGAIQVGDRVDSKLGELIR